MRRTPASSVRWQHVDFDASRVRAFKNLVRGTRTSPKSRRSRSVPMARTVAQAPLVVRAGSNYAPAADEAERVERAFAVALDD